jgi:hypothetical protein
MEWIISVVAIMKTITPNNGLSDQEKSDFSDILL